MNTNAWLYLKKKLIIGGSEELSSVDPQTPLNGDLVFVPVVQLLSQSVEFVWASLTWASTLLVQSSLLTLSSLAAFQCLSSVILRTTVPSQLHKGNEHVCWALMNIRK